MSDPILDALNAPGQPSAAGDPILDALNGKTSPAVVTPTFRGTAAGGAAQGVNDLQNGAAQWLYNSVPPVLQHAGDAADHWLYNKTGGAVGTAPGLSFNGAVADQNTRYETSRQANGRDGIDWARLLSNTGAQTAGALFGGAPAKLTSMTTGLLSGALEPATNIPEGGSTGFSWQKAKDMLFGAGVGRALGIAGSAVAGAVSPNVDPAARKLMDAGIQLTPGQMYGGWFKGMEDKLASVPVFGDLIKGAQGRTVEGLNTAAYKRVLTPLSEAGIPIQVPKSAGREGVESITKQVKDAYNELVPKLAFRADGQFKAEMQGLRNLAQQGLPPTQLAEFERIMQNTVDKNLGSGGSSGKTLQGMLSDLGSMVSGYRSDPSFANRQLGDALATVEKSIKDGLTRSNPHQAKTLAKIDEAFANLARVQSAASSQGASDGVFTAAQLAAAVKGGDKTVRDNAYAQGRALLQDLSDPAKKLLTSSVPNSGTADRAMTAGATGAALANPLQLINPAVIAAAAPSMLYTKPGQAMANFMAKPRSTSVQALADALRKSGEKSTLPINDAALQMLASQLNR